MGKFKKFMILLLILGTAYTLYPKYEMVDSDTRYNKITGTVECYSQNMVQNHSLNPIAPGWTHWVEVI
jgi:hypothetical protein